MARAWQRLKEFFD